MGKTRKKFAIVGDTKNLQFRTQKVQVCAPVSLIRGQFRLGRLAEYQQFLRA